MSWEAPGGVSTPSHPRPPLRPGVSPRPPHPSRHLDNEDAMDEFPVPPPPAPAEQPVQAAVVPAAPEELAAEEQAAACTLQQQQAPQDQAAAVALDSTKACIRAPSAPSRPHTPAARPPQLVILQDQSPKQSNNEKYFWR
ncbi:uncharacterized protein LOC127749545 [Frankliniella occidentalis]|uniref:Uncharacterized protein LOC127749545 n=1 Tax=Frankliniella occidentalis TaxID=133901 RepID=A0A9C6U2I9_FRAOC|nr:uncharacterized protein LOC127749545 [Frankliniella occidentalis]